MEIVDAETADRALRVADKVKDSLFSALRYLMHNIPVGYALMLECNHRHGKPNCPEMGAAKYEAKKHEMDVLIYHSEGKLYIKRVS